MADRLHDQRTQIGEMYHHEVPQTIGQTASNNTRSQKMLTSVNPDMNSHSRCAKEQHQMKGLHMKTHVEAGTKIERICDRSSGCDIEVGERCHTTSGQVHVSKDALSNVAHDDDDQDVVMGQFKNGCEKMSPDQTQSIDSLRERIDSIHLSPVSSGVFLKDIMGTENDAHISTSSSASNTTTTSSSVISIAGQSTTKVKYINQSQPECYEYSRTSYKLDIDPFQDIAGTTRGKSIAQCINDNNKDDICASTAGLATTNQMTFNIACQSPYISVLPPLHACETLTHCHHHHHNHNYHHQPKQSEHFANELTNALSSRMLFQLTNSSYCTNSTSMSQRKRQSSFLKSQSLDFVQDPISILYNDHDEEHMFFQLPEIEEDDLHQKHQQKSSQISDDAEHALLKNEEIIDQTSNSNDKPDETVMITRSLSLSSSSSQKTGVALKSQSLESRPIYPNVPYSPYASPYSSPRSNRRRPPLRESRRISIEQSGSFLQLNQYKLMDQIGQGSYGLVKLAYSEEDSTHYAMKILSKRRLLRQAGLMKRGPKKSTSPLDRVYREIAVLKKLDHPNVVKLVEVLDDPVEDSLYMVFELVKQGEVLSVPTKNPLSEERAWSVFRDTVLGLEYLHYQRIIHADIKPGNLLLTECGRVKIADLGVCNEFIGENATMTNGSTAGTPAFRAPESLNVGQNIYCGKAADIWALGATLYALVYGNVPFVAASVPALYEQIKHDPLSFPENQKISEELRDCVKCMLAKDPKKRITLPQLKEHSWVTAAGLHPLPNEEENCRLVQVNDDDINSVVRSIPKLDTLILIKTMLKKHSFGNPFSRGISGRAPQRGGSRLERFIRAGRSNSAPGSYNMIVDRQLSGDNILPALSEHSASNCTNEESQ